MIKSGSATVRIVAFISVVVVAIVGLVVAVEVEIVPYGATPLINGRLHHLEWYYPPDFRYPWYEMFCFARQDSNYVYFCLQSRDSIRYSGVDIYIDNMMGEIFMLHISSAHGMRYLKDSVWSETEYGPQELWGSNLVELIVNEKGEREVLAPEVYEIQVSKKLLPGRWFKMILHLKRPYLWLPAGADTLSSEQWQVEPFELWRTSSRPMPPH